MNWREHIERKPGVMSGKPVIKGTRITVEHILERLGDGWSQDELTKSYPHITVEAIRAALQFAARSLASDESVFLSESA